ncbi:Sortilin [Branchiostoma belcheri]|nr:Sortilin [Branchiostoma belcheri]
MYNNRSTISSLGSRPPSTPSGRAPKPSLYNSLKIDPTPTSPQSCSNHTFDHMYTPLTCDRSYKTIQRRDNNLRHYDKCGLQLCSEALSHPSKDILDPDSSTNHVRHMRRVEGASGKAGRLQKRAADQPDRSASRCDNTDFTEQVEQGTSKFTFHNETNMSVSMTWAGENNGVLLVLTTDEWGPFVGPTMLWRSTDYGKTFQNISKKINNAYIKKDNGMFKSLLDPARVLLVSYMSDGDSTGSRIYITTDGGETFDGITLDFNVDTLQFHPKNKDYILAHTSHSDVSTTVLLIVCVDNNRSF